MSRVISPEGLQVASGLSRNACQRIAAELGDEERKRDVGAFFGSLRWQQFPMWVGNTWDIEAGDGPYIIRDVLSDRSNIEDFQDKFLEEFGSALAAVGLDIAN